MQAPYCQALAPEPLFFMVVSRTLRPVPFFIGLIFAGPRVGALIGAERAGTAAG